MLNPLTDDKLEQIACNILKCIQNEKKVPYRVENIVRKGEIACLKQFLLFSRCFLQLYYLKYIKMRHCVVIG